MTTTTPKKPAAKKATAPEATEAEVASTPADPVVEPEAAAPAPKEKAPPKPRVKKQGVTTEGPDGTFVSNNVLEETFESNGSLDPKVKTLDNSEPAKGVFYAFGVEHVALGERGEWKVDPETGCITGKA